MENKETSPEKEDKEIGQKEVTMDEKTVQVIIDGSEGLSLEDFHTNDKKVLSLLNQDSDLNDNQYTFNGLARKLGMHQQSLSRALRRLEDAGIVQRTENGYKLSRNLESILVTKSRIDLENLSKKISKRYLKFTQILQLYIPTTLKAKQLVNQLAGKWFGDLRWMGIVEGDGGYVLQWINSDKFQVNLKIISRYAVIESDAIGEKNEADAMVSAYRILEQLTRIVKTASEKSDRRNGLGPFSQYN